MTGQQDSSSEGSLGVVVANGKESPRSQFSQNSIPGLEFAGAVLSQAVGGKSGSGARFQDRETRPLSRRPKESQ